MFLGLGTGVTAASAAEDPTLQVDAVELLPEVITASAYFTRSFAADAAAVGGKADAPARLNLISADARRYVRASDRRYDVIVSDNFHPARSGSGSLYTVEHFQAVRLRLQPGGQQPGGLFCQWLPLHQLDLETLRSIVQSFLAVYPQAWALIASNSLETPVLGLVGRARRKPLRRWRPFAIDWRAWRCRSAWLASGSRTSSRCWAASSRGPKALRRFAARRPVNTDDHPVVAYRAPRITYAPDSSPRDRLIALLREVSIEPGELMLPSSGPDSDPDAPRRLAAYWLARDRFIESGRDVRPSPRVQEMLAQVREPLLSVLRISPDFRPAYDPLLSMATALRRLGCFGRAHAAHRAREDPASARRSGAERSLRLFH